MNLSIWINLILLRTFALYIHTEPAICFFPVLVWFYVMQLSKLDSQVAHHKNFFVRPCRNYVVQYVVELKIPAAAATLLSQFEGNFVYLSMQKFSSHVVEKCLKFSEESRPKIITEFLSVPYFNQLLQDPFANYVIQSALEVSKVWMIPFSSSWYKSSVIFLLCERVRN